MKTLVITGLAAAVLALAGPAVADQDDDLYDQRDEMQMNMSRKAPAGLPGKVTVRGWHRYAKKAVSGRNHTTEFRFTSKTYPGARNFPALSHNRIYTHSVKPRRVRAKRKKLR